MIQEVDRRLQEWIRSVAATADVSLNAPVGSVAGQGVGLYLLEIQPNPPPRSGRRLPPHQVYLRYLVTTWDEDPLKAHEVLGELMFAALDHEELEAEIDFPSVSMWSAFGVAPRPSFILRVPLRRERRLPAAKRVRLPLEVRGSPLASFGGVVLGPGDIPIMNARVEIPALDVSTFTDSEGRFRFPSLPTEPPVKLVRVNAKDTQTLVEGSATDGFRKPLIIRLHGLEG